MRVPSILCALSLLSAIPACDKKGESGDTKEPGSNLLGPQVKDESLGSDETAELHDEAEDGEDEEETAELDSEITEAEKLAHQKKKGPNLPPKATPVQKCTGKGKKRVCKEVDPKPEVSAAYGVYAMMDQGEFKWGQSPDEVFKFVTEEIEKEYEERQAKSKDPTAQDQNIRWRRDRFKEAKQNHVKFVKNANHRWGVSLIQYEYEDDSNEEMIWIKNDSGLRKFFFFKDGELWKILFAYSTESFPGKTYEQVVDEKFKKWFGMSPSPKVKQDPKTAAPILRYNEWVSLGGERVRSFDMTAVHGVIVLALVDGKAEKRIGERLPNVGEDDKVTDVVGDVLGSSDVCYDKSGNISECPTKK
ncbi:MAG: hypothetical protein K1X88_26620 [Nannocystaceae bacterium]|nr:hypothetical protein [Nannocystaceae bacterium]